MLTRCQKCYRILHFYQSQHNRYMETLEAVDLLQIAVLQQDQLERDVGEAKKRKMTRRRRKYHTRPWLAKERRRLYGHYTRLYVYELVQRTRDIPTGFEVACHVDSPSNDTGMFRMLIECHI